MLKTVFTPEYSAIVAQMKGFRERAGLSQRDLAERLAVPQAFIAKLETCERKFDPVEYIVVCRASGATPDELASVIADVGRNITVSDLS